MGSLGEDLEVCPRVTMRSFSRLCAILLIALTVSPVTAPFAAYDLSAIAGEDCHTTTDSKSLKDSTTSIATFVESPGTLEHIIMLFAATVASEANTRQIAPPILRL
jgi:hypothetical protein